jgi:hypothetical protein
VPDTGCVVCQKVPLTGCVVCQKVPVTAIVGAVPILKVGVTAKAGRLVIDVGCVTALPSTLAALDEVIVKQYAAAD